MSYIDLLGFYQPDDRIYTQNVTPESYTEPLFLSKCADLNAALSYRVAYASEAYISANSPEECIGDIITKKGKAYISFDFMKFSQIYDLIRWSETQDRILFLSYDISGIITGISLDQSTFMGTLEVDVCISRTSILQRDVMYKMELTDNSFMIIDDHFSQPVINQKPFSKITQDIKTATYGVFQNTYNKQTDVSVEFAEFKRITGDCCFNGGDAIASRIHTANLFYVDLTCNRKKLLNNYKAPDLSNYIDTINVKNVGIVKYFYIAVINRDYIRERNYYKFNIKAKLI